MSAIGADGQAFQVGDFARCVEADHWGGLNVKPGETVGPITDLLNDYFWTRNGGWFYRKFVRIDAAVSPRSFWLIWSPTGSQPPSKRHNTQEAAQAEAARLAACSGNAEFYVLKAMSRTQAIKVVTEQLP